MSDVSTALTMLPPNSTALAVLAWIGSHAPPCFFPGEAPAELAPSREELEHSLWQLARNGYIEVSDWAKGQGQGFRLTAHGVATYQQLAQTDAAWVQQELGASADITDTAAIARERLLHPPVAVVTPLLMAILIVWFAIGAVQAYRVGGTVEYLSGNNDPVLGWLLPNLGAVSGAALLRGEWWRMVTFGFVHVGLFHLLAHLVILALLGIFAEGVWGRWRFSLIYFLSGLCGAMLSLAVEPEVREAGFPRNVVLAGASGSIWGVTLATVAWLMRNLGCVPHAVALVWIRKILIVAIMNLMVSFYPHINIWCIIGGGISGFIIAICLARIRGWARESAVAVVLLVGFLSIPVLLLNWTMRQIIPWPHLATRNELRNHKAPTPALRADKLTHAP